MSVRLKVVSRPNKRGDCVNNARPCPWVSCRHHLGVEIQKSGAVRETGASETCSLDVADRGEHTLEEVGVILGMSRQAVQQFERRALARLKDRRLGGYR